MFQNGYLFLYYWNLNCVVTFLPLGQKRGECWVWLFSFEEGGPKCFILFYISFIVCFIFLFLFFWHTSRKDCQPSFVQKRKKEKKKKSSVSSRGTSSFSTLRKLLRLGFIWRRNGVTAVQSSIMYKLLYSVFNRSSVKSKIFCIYCTTFYTSFFFKHQCSNLSPSLTKEMGLRKNMGSLM